MTRAATPAVMAEIAAASKRPVFLVKLETTGGWVRAWNGIGDLLWNGETYAGVGAFGGISPIAESGDLRASGIRLTLSGIPVGQIATAQLIRQGYPAWVWLGLLDSNNRLLADPIALFSGQTDTVTLEDAPSSATITVSCETEFIDLRRRVYYYTTADQQLVDATDVGFDYVPLMQDRPIQW